VKDIPYATMGDFVRQICRKGPIELQPASFSTVCTFPADGTVANADPEKVVADPWTFIKAGGVIQQRMDTFLFQEVIIFMSSNASILCCRVRG